MSIAYLAPTLSARSLHHPFGGAHNNRVLHLAQKSPKVVMLNASIAYLDLPHIGIGEEDIL